MSSDFSDVSVLCEVIEYILQYLFSVLHFLDGSCTVSSMLAKHRDQCFGGFFQFVRQIVEMKIHFQLLLYHLHTYVG